jgi:hypothetical protein
MRNADRSEADEVDELIELRIEEWMEFAEANVPLLYEARQAGMQFSALLHEYGKARGRALWPTMMSVRNVDAEVLVAVQ